MTTTRHRAVHALLIDLEAELRQRGLWQATPPPAAALASHQPFCVDTLRFEQWLQFILITRLYSLIERSETLPGHSAIAPMAEEMWQSYRIDCSGVIAVLVQLDEALCSSEPDRLVVAGAHSSAPG